jgi:deoxyribose-phosphate aldolase
LEPALEPDVIRPVTYEDLAGRLDYALLSPALNDDQVAEGLERARSYGVAAVVVRPCDADTALRALQGSAVAVASTAGFPHGTTTTAAKLYEGRDLLRRGVKELDFVINIPGLLARRFQFVETELLQIVESCHQSGAKLKVILETAYLGKDHKVVACRLCSRVGADFASTSTGFAPSGYALEDLPLLRSNLPENIGIKAVGGVETLETALALYAAGCARIETTQPAAILDAWKAELKKTAPAAPAT